jgi:MFS family permease
VTLLRLVGGRTFKSLHAHRNYRLFFVGQVVSVSGTWMQNVALYWYVLTLTHSPIAVGILSFCRFGPFTIFGLFGGTIADRLDNRRTIMVTQAIQMVLSGVLTVLALSGRADVWMIYAIAVGMGTVLVLDAPARQALTFQMVGREELPNAVALNSSLFNLARITGPALAGVVIGAVGIAWCFAANTASFLAVLTSLALMRASELYRVNRPNRPSLLRGTREGLAYVRTSRTAMVILGMMVVFASVCFNFNIMLPVLARETLQQGPRVFGLLFASFGAGALVGALTSAAMARARWKTMLIGATGFALCELALAPVRTAPVAALILFACGAFFTSYTSNSNARIQLDTPDHLRGRVLGLYYYAWNGLAPVGGLLVGWLLSMGGTQLTFTVSGIAGLTMVAAGAFALTRGRGVQPTLRAALPSRAR